VETTAAVVIIGDEILSGKFADENARFLIGELRALGVALRRIVVIPDEVDDIADTVPRYSQRFDWVFTSGGVGPTHDDVTMAGVAAGFGTRVMIHPVLAERLRGFYGPELAERNIRLAEVPEGAELLEGADPSWPVVCYRNVLILPGEPPIFRRKFLAVRERFRCTPYVVHRVYCNGDEGALAPHLDAVVAAFPAAKVGSYPRVEERDYRVLLTIESKQAEVAAAATEDLVRRLGGAVVRIEAPG
jgi:molybdenum cofactor synthesis domain-containing protein